MNRRFRTAAALLGAIVVAGFMFGARTGLAEQGATPTPAAASQRPPVFRGGVNFVSVDVYPRRDGKIIEGLAATDFEVFEDGKPQKVESFEFVRFETNPSDEERRDPSSQNDAERQAADPHNRVFVVYLDMQHTTVPGSSHARQPVVDFLHRTIGARDLFGYMTAEIPASAVTFARRTETIEAELAKYWTWGLDERMGSPTPRTESERRLVQCAYQTGNGLMDDFLINLSREEALQVSLENLVARLRDLRDERKNILFVSEGWVPRGPYDGLVNFSASKGEIPKIGVGPGGRIGIGGNQQGRTSDDTECSVWIRRLISIDFDKRFREFLTTARNANVSFYPIDVGGLKAGGARAEDGAGSGSLSVGGDRTRLNSNKRDTLLTLAENTDGFAVTNTNDLIGGERKITDSLSSFYLLGYYSTNTAVDGRFRRIEVKVARPGVSVSARRGYVALTPPVATASAPSMPAGFDAALARLSRLRDTTELVAHGVVTSGGLQVVAEVAASRRPGLPERGDADSFRVTARQGGGTAITATGTIAAGDRSGAVTLAIDSISTDSWQVTVQLAGATGKIEAQAEIPASSATLVGEALAWRGGQSLRAPLKPLADFRLARTERLRVEWPELQAADTKAARLLSRNGSPLGASLPFATLQPDRRVIAIDLPMSSLPEGDFVLELTATKADTTERRFVAFRVVR